MGEKLPTHVTFYNREVPSQHLSYKIERDVLHHHPVYRCDSKSIEIAYEDNQWEVRYVTRQHRTFWWKGKWVQFTLDLMSSTPARAQVSTRTLLRKVGSEQP